MRNKAISKTQILFIAIIVIIIVVASIWYFIGGMFGPKEKTLVYASNVVVTSADPALYLDEISSSVVLALYDPLVVPAKGGAPQPYLAESWEVSNDGLTYTFHLRQGVKFHDGTELTAEDVVFSMDRILRMGKGYSWLWQDILEPGSTEAVDDYTVKFHLNKPYAAFVSTLVRFFVVNKDLIMQNLEEGEYGEYGDYGATYLQDHDAGSGPYMIDSWEHGSKLELVKFNDYWGGWEENQIDRVIIQIIPEETTIKTMISKGEIDFTHMWMSVESYEAMKQMQGVVVEEDPAFTLYEVLMNNQKPPFDDVHVRRAVLYAFNYTAALYDILKGGVPAQGPVIPGMYGHNPNVKSYEYNLTKAMEELQQSKYTTEELASFQLDYVYVSTIESEEKIGLLLKDNLADIGLTVNLVPETWARMVEMTTNVETTPHFFALFAIAKIGDPDPYLYIFSPKAWGSYQAAMWYNNTEVSALIDLSRETINETERLNILHQIQELITEDAPVLWIGCPLHRIAHTERVKNYEYIGIIGYDLWWYKYTVED